MLLLDVPNRSIRHVFVEMVVLRKRRFDGLGTLENCWGELACVAADEAKEVLESQPGRPQVERPSLARVSVGHVVVLPIPDRVVAILLEDLRYTAVRLRHQRVVTGKPRAELHDHAGSDGVMVAAGEERRAGRRAQCCRVELVVTQPSVGNWLKCGRRNRPPKGAVAPKPTSSGMISRMFGAPFGAVTSAGKSSTASEVRKPALPLNCGWGIGSTDRFQSGSAS